VTVEIADAELNGRMNLDLQTAVRDLEEMRMLARSVQKYAGLGGAPEEIQTELGELARLTESLEARLGGYAVEVAA
jgi:hypothetical protein